MYSKLVFLDLFWDNDLNGGSIKDVNPCFNNVDKYWWKCYGCGNSYQKTIKRMLLDFKMLKGDQLDMYCPTCLSKGSCKIHNTFDFLDYIDGKDKDLYIDIVKDFLENKNTTYSFYTYCPDCGVFHSATESTFSIRGGFYCKCCYTNHKALKKYGSLADKKPEIIPYYSSKNKVPINKLPVWKITDIDNKVHLICPKCGVEHTKRMDAVLNNGAYCQGCVRKISSIQNNSLYDNYPEVAEMFDRGGNSISSKEVSCGNNLDTYGFECRSKELPRHIIYKTVYDMVSAYRRGNLGCPICQGYGVISGVNDFKSRVSEMAKYWDYDKNNVRPEEVYYKSRDKYYFICEEGHSFMRDPNHMRRSINTTTKGCPVCHGKRVVKGVNDLATLRPDLVDEFDKFFNPDLNLDEVTMHSNRLVSVACKGCGNMFETTIYNWVNGLVCFCEDCRKRQYSKAEKELSSTIKSWGINVVEESNILGDYSLDIYIPSKSIAVEYNGLYWHSDAVRKDSNYHYKKYKLCEERGIQLIYVWEDDYINKREIVLNLLRNKLGLSNNRKVDARNCLVCQEEYKDVKEFLEKYHIQGSVKGSLYISLRESIDSDIVALGVFQDKGSGVVLLSRYCTSCNVRGGFTKVLSVLKDVFGFTVVETFSDNGVSDGSLYKNSGFIKTGILKPDYSYLVEGRRVHKFNYRKERFKNDKNLLYKDGLTESELALLNSIPRVWDAGKVKWSKNL